MPELPEVQAHAERLSAEFDGAVLERFQPLTFTALKTAVPSPDEAVGLALGPVRRRGKLLLVPFGPVTFVVHLMQGGRLKPDDKQVPKPKGGLARWRFGDGRALLLTEAGKERRAGVWCHPTTDALSRPPLGDLGPEALELTPAALAARFAANPMRLHGFLRDQRCIAGIGRRLANEVCHRARLSPFAATAKLGTAGAEQVVAAIHLCVEEGLSYERSRPDMSSSADRPGSVHHRTGLPCPVCGDTIREVAYSSYTIHYCPTCQTGGKVLADNTTSRFLR
ncbi:MAG TPA: DNA-formamidopyrimidine glycosylase family protein [Acidimicrobiales bacterium]